MRLGGPVLTGYEDPDQWVAALRERGYSAAYCPLEADADDDTVRALVKATRAADIVIAEVGAWSNPLSPDPEIRKQALTYCKQRLHLADRLGARCCVNIAGSRGTSWDGPHPDDLTEATFGLIVETVREIIDEVQPTQTYYTLETMPWMYPDSADSYLSLLEAIDRERFAVHLDPANLICSPQRYFRNTRILRECFDKLGPFIRSCHAKDVILREQFMVHIDETRPGLGKLDYTTFLRELSRLPADTPLMLEHLSTEEEYRLAADHIRSVAAAANLPLHGQR
jgi:sugar phosphate isomerase/epimerase